MNYFKYKPLNQLKQELVDKELKLTLNDTCWCGCRDGRYRCIDDYWDYEYEYDWITNTYYNVYGRDHYEEANWEWWNESPERLRQIKLDELFSVHTNQIEDFFQKNLHNGSKAV